MFLFNRWVYSKTSHSVHPFWHNTCMTKTRTDHATCDIYYQIKSNLYIYIYIYFFFRQWGSTLYGKDTQVHRTDTRKQYAAIDSCISMRRKKRSRLRPASLVSTVNSLSSWTVPCSSPWPHAFTLDALPSLTSSLNGELAMCSPSLSTFTRCSPTSFGENKIPGWHTDIQRWEDFVPTYYIQLYSPFLVERKK